MADAAGRSAGIRPKTLVFIGIAVMAAYVLYHNESFLIDSASPAWRHYEPFKWWLLGHGVAGACALILAPLQFWDSLRQRHTTLHRVIGTIYVTGAMVLAPLGAYIQYLDEAQGSARSFTIETIFQSSFLVITTGIALIFALKRMFRQHRQWMTRSFAVALVFLEVRFILGVFGLDQPFDWAITETVVWSCTASAILLADLANQWHELATTRLRPRAIRAQAPETAFAPAAE